MGMQGWRLRALGYTPLKETHLIDVICFTTSAGECRSMSLL